MVTIHDVAKLAGVSTATVSRSFVDSSALSTKTRERVLEIAGGLNYRPRGSDRPNVGRRMLEPSVTAGKTIGFEYFSYSSADLLPTNSFYSEVLAGAQSEAASLGMHLLISTTHRHMLIDELPPMVRDQAVSGMLLVGTADEEILQSFVKLVTHIVLLDNHDKSGQYDTIYSDGFGGAYAATQHLLDLGHRNIGFLTTRIPANTFIDRLNGYVCAHFHANVAVDRGNVLAIGHREEVVDKGISGTELRLRSIREITEYLQVSPHPTAFVAANDDNAINLYRACNLLDIMVPSDMSIVGFDDISVASELEPPLTTVRLDTLEMGRMAVRKLHARIVSAEVGKKPSAGISEQLPVKLIIRGSTAVRHE